MLLLFVRFPQLTLQEPKDCISVIRSIMSLLMLRLVDAVPRRGARGLKSIPGPKKRLGGLASFFSGGVQSFKYEGKRGRNQAATRWLNSPGAPRIFRQPSTDILSLWMIPCYNYRMYQSYQY